MARPNRAGKMHSLKDARHPVLVKKNGERIVAQTELGQLQEKRERIVAQLDEIDGEIVALKKKRHAELMAEIEELGLNAPPSAASGSKKISRQRDPLKPCKVCGETGHDARRHRSDGKKSVEAAT
jgi:hypothetical protein